MGGPHLRMHLPGFWDSELVQRPPGASGTNLSRWFQQLMTLKAGTGAVGRRDASRPGGGARSSCARACRGIPSSPGPSATLPTLNPLGGPDLFTRQLPGAWGAGSGVGEAMRKHVPSARGTRANHPRSLPAGQSPQTTSGEATGGVGEERGESPPPEGAARTSGYFRPGLPEAPPTRPLPRPVSARATAAAWRARTCGRRWSSGSAPWPSVRRSWSTRR